MQGEQINIIDNIIQAISILNKTDEYLEGLGQRLSEYDILKSGFYHYIEMTPIEKVNLEKLYLSMQNILKKRRSIKMDMDIHSCYKNNIAKLNNVDNRQFLIAELKKLQNKKEIQFQEYENEKLPQEILYKIQKKEEVVAKRGRGRPKKDKGVE